MTAALYFPFSRCLDLLTLKRAVLVYDQLLFIDPVTPEARSALYLREQHTDPNVTQRWMAAQHAYDLLDQAGIARTVTADVLKDSKVLDTFVADGLHTDITINKASKTLFKGRPRWRMLESRVTPSMRKGRHRPTQAPAFGGEQIVEVSYAAGSSLSLTYALAIAHDLEAAPLTDSPAHHQLLLYRLRTAAAAGADQLPGLHAQPASAPPDQYLRRQIELRVIDALVPDDALVGMDLSELIDYRRDREPARQQLSGWLDELTEKAHHRPWDSGLEAELHRIAAEAREIARQPGRWGSMVGASRGQMSVGQLTVNAGLAAVPLLSGVVLGWPLIAGLATGVALGVAPPALAAAIDAMVKRRPPERNAVAYLMRAGRR